MEDGVDVGYVVVVVVFVMALVAILVTGAHI